MSGLRSIPNVKIMAGMVQGFGRKGDTMLAHITPTEAKLLKKHGGAGTKNPKTGLMEFWGGDSDDSDSPGTAGGGDSVGGFGDHGSLGGAESSIGGPGGDGGNYADRSDGFGSGGLGGGYGPGGFFNENEDFSREDEISERAGGVNWNDYQMQNYKEAGTLGRLGQELVSPSQITSRMGVPTAQQLGLLGPAMGFLAGPVMGLAMMAGAAMGRAQTPAEQAASMAEMSSRGAQNSTGQDRDSVSGTGVDGANVGKMAGVTSVAPTPTPPKLTPESWDETGFLERNPEVKNAVQNGTWASGYAFDQAYRSASGTPYEVAMTTDRNDPKESWLSTRPGQAVPYGGYRGY